MPSDPLPSPNIEFRAEPAPHPAQDAAHEIALPSLRPNLFVLIAGSSAVAALSFAFLAWPIAIASTVLGTLMIAGADVDARTFLLPNFVTYGALVCGLLAAPMIDPATPWYDIGMALLRAAGTFLLLAGLRAAYAALRQDEGLGFGDVKLAAAIGAWLPLEAIPYCFGLATTAALLSVIVHARGATMQGMKLPFGAFLCPALWLLFFMSCLNR